jgi:peptide chain release factor 3
MDWRIRDRSLCAWPAANVVMRLKVVRAAARGVAAQHRGQLHEPAPRAVDGLAGDIIGIPEPRRAAAGRTLTEGEVPQVFTGRLFAPEMFRAVEVADPLRSKQLRRADEAGEEGAIQVCPIAGSLLLLGAVGQLRFEVVAHRLEHGVRRQGAHHAKQLQPGALVDQGDDANELRLWMPTSTARRVDAVDAPIAGRPTAPRCAPLEQQWPKIMFSCASMWAGVSGKM